MPRAPPPPRRNPRSRAPPPDREGPAGAPCSETEGRRGRITRMGRFAQILAGTLFVVAAFALPSPAQGGEGWWGDLDKGQSVRLGDVVEAPEGFRGRTITFTCVFHQREREFNPLRTRFNSERYENVS